MWVHGKCVCVTERDSVGDALIGCLNRRDFSYEDDITLNTQIHADDINSGSLLVAGVCAYFDWPGVPSGWDLIESFEIQHPMMNTAHDLWLLLYVTPILWLVSLPQSIFNINRKGNENSRNIKWECNWESEVCGCYQLIISVKVRRTRFVEP